MTVPEFLRRLSVLRLPFFFSRNFMKNKIDEEPAYTELSHITQGYIVLNIDVSRAFNEHRIL